METIRSYVETMFKALPEEESVLKIKQGLLESMEDKYNALKADGKNEAEAVGQVISEFGNIDEITAELGIEEVKKTAEAIDEKFITDEEANDYIRAQRSGSIMVGIGVVLCILAPAALMFIAALSEYSINGFVLSEDYSGAFGMCAMFLLITVAVALFIISGIKLERYEKYEKTPIKISNSMRAQVTAKKEAYTVKFAVSIACGVGLVLAGVIALILLGITPVGGLVATPTLLAFIAAGVYLFITAGMRHGSYETLLETGDYSREKKQKKTSKGSKTADVINSVMWPLVVAGYLIWSFTTNNWHITWIVFPVAGLISGAISGVTSALDDK